jgi:hypothetical protein
MRLRAGFAVGEELRFAEAAGTQDQELLEQVLRGLGI